MNYKLPKLGMRSIKTVIATTMAIFVSNLLGFHSGFYATWTAFLCIQTSIIDSSNMAKKRGKGTLIGGIFSLVYLIFMPYNNYAIPIGILGIIYLCNLIKKTELISIACVVFLVISFKVNTTQDFDATVYVVDRVLETFIGMIIAMLVNYYIKPPNPFSKLQYIDEFMTNFLEENIRESRNTHKIKNLENYRLKLHELRNLIEFYHREIDSHRHELDIKAYMERLTLFRMAFSHMYILNTIKENKEEPMKEYHVEKLMNIKKILSK